MKAAVVRAFGEPLVIEERPDPEPGPGQVRVRVEASGLCEHCLSGWETLCEQQINTGYGCDGGYAEKMLAWADFAQPVPDGISALEAAPLTCAGVTTYKALKVAEVRPAQLVA